MFNQMDPVTKQLWIFSFIVSVIIGALLSFLAVELLRNSFLYGFPISLKNAAGLGSFFIRLVNSFALGTILTPLTYYTVKYLQTRVRI